MITPIIIGLGWKGTVKVSTFVNMGISFFCFACMYFSQHSYVSTVKATNCFLQESVMGTEIVILRHVIDQDIFFQI